VPSYGFRFDACEHEFTIDMTFAEHGVRKGPLPSGFCVECERHSTYRQVLSFSYRPSLREHYNPAVGQHISTDAQFRSELTRASDIQSERTGITHNYQPIDIDDPQSLGVTGEGLDATYAEETRSGRREAKKYL